MFAFCEAESFDEWERLVDEYEENWDRDIVFYRNMTMLDVAYEIIDECYDLERMLGRLSSYFDYAAFARDLSYDGCIETEYGVLEIR